MDMFSIALWFLRNNVRSLILFATSRCEGYVSEEMSFVQGGLREDRESKGDGHQARADRLLLGATLEERGWREEDSLQYGAPELNTCMRRASSGRGRRSRDR